MKKFSYEIKHENHSVQYIVKAENKEDAIRKIQQICGERVAKVKEI